MAERRIQGLQRVDAQHALQTLDATLSHRSAGASRLPGKTLPSRWTLVQLQRSPPAGWPSFWGSFAGPTGCALRPSPALGPAPTAPLASSVEFGPSRSPSPPVSPPPSASAGADFWRAPSAGGAVRITRHGALRITYLVTSPT